MGHKQLQEGACGPIAVRVRTTLTAVPSSTACLTDLSLRTYLFSYLSIYLCSHFFSGDSYILLYTYQKGGSVQYMLYFWLGKDSTPDEKGAAALLAIALDGGSA